MKLITVKDLSGLIRVKESTLYAWASKGSIPSHKLNGLLRFDLEEIEEWIKKFKKEAGIPEKKTRKSSKITGSYDIEEIVRKAIDDAKGTGYNPPQRGSQAIQPRKEVD